MHYEKSCGIIPILVTDSGRRYLVIRSVNGQYGFPKGHVEAGETEIETALRELWEETGAEASILLGFRAETEYPLPGHEGVYKRVVYFLGRCSTEALRCQESEVLEAAFLTYPEALARMTFPNNRRILEQAEQFLNASDGAGMR